MSALSSTPPPELPPTLCVACVIILLGFCFLCATALARFFALLP